MFAQRALVTTSRAASRSMTTTMAKRTFVKPTMPTLMVNHPTFEPPFPKGATAAMLIGMLVVGSGCIIGGWKFQNKKQGFTK